MENSTPCRKTTRTFRPDKPKPNSQQGRILALLESAHGCGNALTCPWTACGRISLPKILELYISQYSARLHELRHDWGFLIENGKADDGDDSHTWFRLSGRREETTLRD